MSNKENQDNRVDIAEVFAAIRARFFLIICFGVVFLVIARSYAIYVAVPQFVAVSRFELTEHNGSAANLGNASGLAAIAGLSLPATATEANTMRDRILSLKFIEQIYDDAKFESDPVFNPALAEPSWKARVKAFMFGPVPPPEFADLDYLLAAKGELSQRMEFTVGENGIITIEVKHPISERAALVANTVVEGALNDVFERKRKEARESLSYFSDELLQVRSDLDNAAAALSDYAVRNNLQSADNLTRTSTQLSQIRSELAEARDTLFAVKSLSSIQADAFNPTLFAARQPISESIGFRRFFGWSPNPATWSKPMDAEIETAQRILADSIDLLEKNQVALEKLARAQGDEARELSRLERELEVQRTIYESVITQFEAQSLFAGFETASGRLIEKAIAPGGPREPKIMQLMLIGLGFGLMVGVGVSILLSSRSGVLYLGSSIKYAFNSSNAIDVKYGSLPKTSSAPLKAKTRDVFEDVVLSLNPASKTISVVTTGKQSIALQIASGIAKTQGSLGEKTAILDLSKFQKKETLDNATIEGVEGLISTEIENNVWMFNVRDFGDFLRRDRAKEILESLGERFDKVILVCPSIENRIAETILAILHSDEALVIAQKGRTGHEAVDRVRKLLNRAKHNEPLLLIL